MSLTQTYLNVITRMANWLLMTVTSIVLEATNHLVCLSSHSSYLYMYLYIFVCSSKVQDILLGKLRTDLPLLNMNRDAAL